MSDDAVNAAMHFIAWSRVFSPVVPKELRAEAWEALGLPGPFERVEGEYWSLFHIGMPGPPIPLLLHSALNMDGQGAREDWLRVIHHLELSWDDVHLPPDQLGAACEVYACAIEREEPVLITELRQRYLLPWCAMAKAKLAETEHELLALVERFEADLLAA